MKLFWFFNFSNFVFQSKANVFLRAVILNQSKGADKNFCFFATEKKIKSQLQINKITQKYLLKI